MATSSISGVGSLVVILCTQRPGAEIARVMKLGCLPAKRIISKPRPISKGKIARRIRVYAQVGSPAMRVFMMRPAKIPRSIIKNIKLVPQRGWKREYLAAFSGVSSTPASKQAMDLCSAP